MKRIELLLFLLTLPFAKSIATEQIHDRLIYKGDTIPISPFPLEQLYNIDSIRNKFFANSERCRSTACYRGYKAEWVIINDQLYLTGILKCCFNEDNEDTIKADLKELFGNKFKDGKVKADWFSGNITAPLGKQLLSVHMGNVSMYEKELELQFKNGQLIGTKSYDNKKYFKKIKRDSKSVKPSP